MKEIPILFSTEMVRAILDGRKNMTRRVIKPQPPDWINKFGYTMFTPPGHISGRGYWEGVPGDEGPGEKFFKCPYGQPGDRLWVRETWFCDECDPACAGRENEDECPFNRVDNYCYGYKAQYITGWHENIKWRPSIFMPKAAARIWLEVTDVRVERLQEISKNDAWREGVCDSWEYDTVAYFRELWDKLNAKRGYGWESNPWLWVVSFRRV